jgi:hypothetical protein
MSIVTLILKYASLLAPLGLQTRAFLKIDVHASISRYSLSRHATEIMLLVCTRFMKNDQLAQLSSGIYITLMLELVLEKSNSLRWLGFRVVLPRTLGVTVKVPNLCPKNAQAIKINEF